MPARLREGGALLCALTLLITCVMRSGVQAVSREAEAVRTIRLGMYATLAPTMLNEATAVLSSWFEANGSRRIEFVLSPSYGAMLQAALTENLDFYALEPHAAYFFIHQRGYRPVTLLREHWASDTWRRVASPAHCRLR